MTARHGAGAPALAGALALCLLCGCESGSRDAAPASASASASVGSSVTAVPSPVTRGPPPPVAAVTRLLVDSTDDPTDVTVDVPPDPEGYLVAAGCAGPAGASVSWTVTPAVGPVGDPATGTAPCDGADHTGQALPGTPVAVQVRLHLDVDLGAVSSAWATLRPVG